MPSGVKIWLVSRQLDGLAVRLDAPVKPVLWRLGSAGGKGGRARPDCDAFNFLLRSQASCS